MGASKSTARSPCTAPDLDRRGAVSLPVLPGHDPRGTIRRSKSGRRRAIVLAAVQGLMIAHVVLWLLSRKYGWWGGRTTTPVEPSESMEFFKNGVVNAGLIFFAIALLTTLVLGRWFCGWGCHLVMLQDLCAWIMKRLGVRPKPFRSRLLIYVPLVLALYMFLWPAFYRLAVAPWVQPDLTWSGFSVHLTTTEFWKTFPGLMVAVPFLAVCGFATVYFLGAKGFCTYGCPYGGFFAPLDEFAVGRIRVTDACEHCGHCTAVCTSNVRVHEEVREYGMVVDPGCMKCLDCVSVCPNDALYFGFGRPAQWKGEAAHRRPVRKYDLTWPEELAFAGVFLLSFLAVRGIYGLVPMLMAAGVAGVVTFLAWKLWRLARDPDAALHRHQLKLRGRMQRPGWIFAVIAGAVLLLAAHCGVVTAAEAVGSWSNRRVRAVLSPVAVFAEAPAPLPPGTAADVDRGIRFYGLASRLGEGGIGLAPVPDLDVQLAWLHSCRGDFRAAERHLARAMLRTGPSESLSLDYAHILAAQADRPALLRHYEEALAAHEGWTVLLEDMVHTCRRHGLSGEAIGICRARLERFPSDQPALRWLALLLLDADRPGDAIEPIERIIALNPSGSIEPLTALAVTLARAGRGQDAVDAMNRALDLAPEDPDLLRQMAGLLEFLGRQEEAKEYLERSGGPGP